MPLDDVISSLIKRLAQEQQVDGSFLVSLFSTGDGGEKPRQAASAFFLGLISSCLAAVPSGMAMDDIKKKLGGILRQQISPHGSVNYWLRGEPEALIHPYPDDLDSTSCVLAAMSLLDPHAIDGELLARLVKILTCLEDQEGGPYRTWIISPEAEDVWKDVDVAVNANIAYFLSLQGVRVPGLDRYLEKCISEGCYVSPYYPAAFPIWYFLSRTPIGKVSSKLADDILACRKSDGTWGTLLETACAINALLNMSFTPSLLTDNIDWLRHQAEKADVLLPQAFCIDSKKGDRIRYAGSGILTIAFCLEVLVKNEQLCTTMTLAAASTREASEEERILEEIHRRLKQRASQLPTDLGEPLSFLCLKVITSVEEQGIPLLPCRFHRCLREVFSRVSEDDLVTLGLINVYGWMAYTIYDDFLDEEGKLEFLPAANLCLRELSALLLHDFSDHESIQTIFCQVMDGIDAANAWEVKHCRLSKTEEGFILPQRLPDYGDYIVLAERSFGHALGPMAVLLSQGVLESSSDFAHLRGFFQYYLIARQINDDAHDWEEDLRKGHLNSVSVRLLERWRERSSRTERLHFDDLPAIQYLFWSETLPEIANVILDHTRQARERLKCISIFKDDKLLQALLVPAQRAAEVAIKEQERAQSFLRTYRSDLA